MASLYSLAIVLSCFVVLWSITQSMASTNVWRKLRYLESEQSSIKKNLIRMEENRKLDLNVFQEDIHRKLNGSSDGQLVEINGASRAVNDLIQHQQNQIHQLKTMVFDLSRKVSNPLQCDTRSIHTQLKVLREEFRQMLDSKQQVQTYGNTGQKVKEIPPTIDTRGDSTHESSSVPPSTTETGEAPVVWIEKKKQDLLEGTTGTIRCIVMGRPKPTITWRRDRGKLSSNHQVSWNGEILRIKRVSIADRGFYFCRARNVAGRARGRAIINVERRERPVVEVNPSGSLTIGLGDSARVLCIVTSGTPTPTISWTRAGNESFTSNTDIMANGVIEFKKVTGDEEGSYVCTAVNSMGTATATAVLRVRVPPTVVVGQNNQTVKVGETVELRCEVSGSPLPTVRWRKDGGSLPNQHLVRNGVLIIYEVSAEDSGRYICIADNEAGSSRDFTFLHVQSVPVVFTQTANVGERVKLECILSGNPCPTITWSKLEGTLPASAVIGKDILIIPEVRVEDAGIYLCTATNAAGTVQSQVQLFVGARPVLSIPESIKTVTLGGTVTWSCEAWGYPAPYITWTKKEGELPREHSVTDGQLTIPRVREEDGGTYTCNATNTFGTAQIHFILVVGEIGYSFKVTGYGYVELDKGLLPLQRHPTGVSIEMTVQTDELNGLLFWQGQDPNTRLREGDYIAIVLVDGFVEFRYELGSGEAHIRSKLQINDGLPHKIIAQRVGRSGNLAVDGGPPVKGASVGPLQVINVRGNIYLGGLPDLDAMTDGKVTENFNGCITDVKIQNKEPIYVSRDAVTRFNVRPCQEAKP